MRRTCFWLALAFNGIWLPATGYAGVSHDAFLVRTTADLVDLCTAAPDDPLATAAQNFCHGFSVGVYRVLAEIDRADIGRTFCMPTPMPTRNEWLASFVQWVKANPNQSAHPPQDGIAAFLSSRYPCGTGKP